MMTRFILFMYSRVPALCVLTRTHMHYSYYNITTTRLSMADTSSAIEIEEYGLLQPETNPYISSTASSRSPSSVSVHKPSSFSSVNDLYDTVTSSVSTSLTRDIAKGLYFNLTLFLLNLPDRYAGRCYRHLVTRFRLQLHRRHSSRHVQLRAARHAQGSGVLDPELLSRHLHDHLSGGGTGRSLRKSGAQVVGLSVVLGADHLATRMRNCVDGREKLRVGGFWTARTGRHSGVDACGWYGADCHDQDAGSRDHHCVDHGPDTRCAQRSKLLPVLEASDAVSGDVQEVVNNLIRLRGSFRQCSRSVVYWS